MSEKLTPNTTLSHYRIISKIGEGGMGEVYLAQDIHRKQTALRKLLRYWRLGSQPFRVVVDNAVRSL